MTGHTMRLISSTSSFSSSQRASTPLPTTTSSPPGCAFSSLMPAAISPEITVVFCDLRGFTGFAETVEPEDVMDVLNEYHAALGDLIHRFEGTLEPYERSAADDLSFRTLAEREAQGDDDELTAAAQAAADAGRRWNEEFAIPVMEEVRTNGVGSVTTGTAASGEAAGATEGPAKDGSGASAGGCEAAGGASGTGGGGGRTPAFARASFAM